MSDTKKQQLGSFSLGASHVFRSAWIAHSPWDGPGIFTDTLFPSSELYWIFDPTICLVGLVNRNSPPLPFMKMEIVYLSKIFFWWFSEVALGACSSTDSKSLLERLIKPGMEWCVSLMCFTQLSQGTPERTLELETSSLTRGRKKTSYTHGSCFINNSLKVGFVKKSRTDVQCCCCYLGLPGNRKKNMNKLYFYHIPNFCKRIPYRYRFYKRK